MADAVRHATLQSAPSTGFVPGGGNYELWRVYDAELVNGTAAVESVTSIFVDHAGARQVVRGFLLTQFRYFGLHVIATSVTGTADVAVAILESWDDVAANYVIPNAGGTLTSSIADELAHVYSVSPAPMPRLRFRVTGNAANPTDTVVTAYFWMQT